MTRDQDPPVLVVNAGSSSLKYQLLQPVSGTVQARGLIERIGGSAARHLHHVGDEESVSHTAVADAAQAIRAMIAAFAEHGPDLTAAGSAPVAVGHRVVHGGAEFSAAVLIDERVKDAIVRLTPLAPLHNPANLAGILATQELLPDLPQVAVFDTAFHSTIPPAAHTYAVPELWRVAYGVRRYGFHGTSHQYVSGRAAHLLGNPAAKLVVLHLGNGCSACAVDTGRSIETSMGLTPLEGLLMGTRSGDLDPSIPGHLARVAGMSAEEVDNGLNRESGLLGLVGDSDFRELLRRRDLGDQAAVLAFDMVIHRLVKYIGAYAAALGGLDAVVFTGGIGENSAALRAAVMDRLRMFGVTPEPAPDTGSAERRISAAGSRTAVLVIPTDEERQIAQECLAVLKPIRL